MPHTTDPLDPEAFAAAHESWHAEVEAGRTAPHGPLSVTALHWLTEDPQRFAEAPGTWRADRSTGIVTAEIPEEAGVTRDGVALSGTVRFEPLTGIESLTLDWGEQRLELAARSGGIVLRPRDPASPDRAGYAGTETFPPSLEWVVRARFAPVPRETVEVESAAGPTAKQHYDSPGTAEFEIDGRAVRLTLFGERDGSPLRALFADLTGEDLTFPATRFVSVARIDDETVEIDFNRTSNLPCAYSASATCPFPPPENRLPVRIEAGGLRPGISRARATTGQ